MESVQTTAETLKTTLEHMQALERMRRIARKAKAVNKADAH
jgi:hypothetical protein